MMRAISLDIERRPDTIRKMVAWQDFFESKPNVCGGEVCAVCNSDIQ